MPQRPEDIPPHWAVRSIIDALSRARPYLRERYHVREIGVFGSYVQSAQGTESDLDILVELDEPLGWDIVDLKEDLKRILNLPVDLVLSGGITRRPRLMQAIDAEAVYVQARRDSADCRYPGGEIVPKRSPNIGTSRLERLNP